MGVGSDLKIGNVLVQGCTNGGLSIESWSGVGCIGVRRSELMLRGHNILLHMRMRFLVGNKMERKVNLYVTKDIIKLKNIFFICFCVMMSPISLHNKKDWRAP